MDDHDGTGRPYLSGVALALSDEEVARAVARQRLASQTTTTPVAPFADCAYIGRAVGLTVAEIQRNSGYSKQTVYRLAPPDDELRRQPPMSQACAEVLILLAHEGLASVPKLAAVGALREDAVQRALRQLADDGLCAISRDDFTGVDQVTPVPATYDVLRGMFDDLYLRRSDAFSIYIAVPPDFRERIASGAAQVLAAHEHDILDQSVAPSVMDGPELALTAYTATVRTAISLTRDLWFDILDAAEITRFEPVITNVIPPGAVAAIASPVLDAFFEALIEAGSPSAETLRVTRAGFAGDVPERTLAGRCVTMAAIALRRALGNTKEPRWIEDGESAFAEWQPAHGISVDKPREPIRTATVKALDLATDRLGPLAGGRLAHLRAPGQPPVIVETIRPTPDDLTTMARLAGTAVGTAAALDKIDVVQAMRRVVTGAGPWA